MFATRQVFIAGVAVALMAGASAPATARSVGQVIDDTKITTEIKAKLAADKLSTLTRIDVTTDNGIVTLTGVVDEAERRARAAQIAAGVGGVKGIVNNIHVAGTTIPPAPGTAQPTAPATGGATPSSAGRVDATGVVAHVDQSTGTITLQDGRIVRLTPSSVVWQPSTIQSLRPGAQVFVREAAPVTVQTSPTVAPEWRMGTVRIVDRATNRIVLTDGAIVRVAPTAVVRRGSEQITIDRIPPGSEIVVRTMPRSAAAEGSALPGPTASTTVDAAEVTVVWTPVTGAR
jgi:hypothetical protein